MSLNKRKIIITGGPTREWLDPVRFISNPSTGKMGIAIADEAHNRGGDTVFIHGPVDSSLLQGRPYRMRAVETTSDLLDAVMSEMTDRAILVMAAAPVDYKPAEKSDVKIKKSGDELQVRFSRTPDILRNVSLKRESGELRDIFVAGFAAETTDIENYALGKLRDKNLDMICLNDVSAKGSGFGTDTNQIIIFTRDGERQDLPIMTKKEAASMILDAVERGLV